jgi:hypothetical protein
VFNRIHGNYKIKRISRERKAYSISTYPPGITATSITHSLGIAVDETNSQTRVERHPRKSTSTTGNFQQPKRLPVFELSDRIENLRVTNPVVASRKQNGFKPSIALAGAAA